MRRGKVGKVDGESSIEDAAVSAGVAIVKVCFAARVLHRTSQGSLMLESSTCVSRAHYGFLVGPGAMWGAFSCIL